MKPRRIKPGPGQESVWDYPRPPRLETCSKTLRVMLRGVVLAETNRGSCVLETSHPPTYYIPPADIQMTYLVENAKLTFCEWKGQGQYYDVQIGDQLVKHAAWFYPNPLAPFEALAGCIAFYASKMDACYVDDEVVQSQPGDFYGGWITKNIVGPFKGDPGTWGW